MTWQDDARALCEDCVALDRHDPAGFAGVKASVVLAALDSGNKRQSKTLMTSLETWLDGAWRAGIELAPLDPRVSDLFRLLSRCRSIVCEAFGDIHISGKHWAKTEGAAVRTEGQHEHLTDTREAEEK